LLVMFTFSFSTALRLWSLEVTWAWRMWGSQGGCCHFSSEVYVSLMKHFSSMKWSPGDGNQSWLREWTTRASSSLSFSDSEGWTFTFILRCGNAGTLHRCNVKPAFSVASDMKAWGFIWPRLPARPLFSPVFRLQDDLPPLPVDSVALQALRLPLKSSL
jgi:hypothetical protein